MPEQRQNSGSSPNRSGGGGNANRNRNRNRSRSGGGGSGGSGGGGGNRGGNRGGGGGQSRSGGGSQNRDRSGPSRSAAAVAPIVLAPLVIEPGLGATEVLPEEIAANRRRALWLCALTGFVPALILGVILALVTSLVIGAVVFVVLWALKSVALWRMAPGMALKAVGATPLAERDNPRLTNVTDGLCATFGLRMPDLYVVWDAVPNACALGRDASSAALVVTSGLLETMGPIELEGVIAHELAHVKRHDNTVSVIALTLARFGGEGLLRRCVGKNREYRADVVAASAVRFPRGLFDALRLMEQAPEPAGNSVFGPGRFGSTRFVWIDPTVGHRHDAPVPGDLDVTSVRAAALSEW
jgi:Zn-dependent protease with chaperone function